MSFRLLLLASLSLAVACVHPSLAQQSSSAVLDGVEEFEKRIVVSGLMDPWELTWGPDDYLWVTERAAGRITRIDPESGSAKPALTIGEVSAASRQDGLLGMTLHPEMLQGHGHDYAYVAYTYESTITDAATDGSDRHLAAKIVAFEYDPESETLNRPRDLITGLPASNDHNSGRLKLGPDGKLYYTVGDQGSNQFGNACNPVLSQRLPTVEEISRNDYRAYAGKTLRLNLDGSIPPDNPVLDGVRSHVFTYGHRNMQGLAFGPDGTFYGAEHGPKTDDEINALVAGGNYGWPLVAGFQDDRAYVYANWSGAGDGCAELTFSNNAIPASVPVLEESAWTAPENFVEPLATMFTVPSTHEFSDPACGSVDFVCWPTIAPSSIEVYAPEAETIPGWSRSLIVSSLKRGSIYRIKLNEAGTGVSGPFYRYFNSENRYRDVAIGPDQRTIYVATDATGVTEALDGGVTWNLEARGAILAFTYQDHGAGN